MSQIDIKHLTYQFPDQCVGLDDISMSVKKGEFVIIAGPNGSGKTTLCRHLNGLITVKKNCITIDGLKLPKDVSQIRQLVGMVFQNADHQIVGQTVYDEVAFGPENLKLSRTEINQRVIQSLKTVGLEEYQERRPHTLSGGEKRKLVIAGILAMNSEILVFDEPFSNLDYPGTQQVLEQILKLHQLGHTIIVVTHELEKTIAYANRLIVLQQGKIVLDDRPELIIHEVEKYGIKEPFSSKYGKGLIKWLN